ncbi:unnamed protein product [Urochloa decumbens]|uniref:Uncharacterized protein n=1 Tax=Urochloa decumbens TaxID=240449 RepID=A0ABC8YGR1_9POAL
MPPPGSRAAHVDDAPSASAIFAGRVTGHHVLHIEDYSRTKEDLPNGKGIKSRPFRVGGCSWSLMYYPNGERSQYADCISMFLSLQESAAATGPVKARAKYSLLDRAGKPVLSHTKDAELHEYAVGGTGYGFYDFIKRDLLEPSEHLKDDCFKVRCDIFIREGLSTEDRPAAPAFVDVPASDMHQQFGDLLTSNVGADVTFQVSGETFRAHRCILAARSPVFKAELFGAMREGTAAGDHCIRIDGTLGQVFKNLLHFVYTDSLPETPEMEVPQEGAAMAQHLLEAADRYDLQRLKLLCERKLCGYMDVSTVATTLVLAEQHHCGGLKDACIEFLKSPHVLEAVVATDGFEHLTTSCPALLKELMCKLVAR